MNILMIVIFSIFGIFLGIAIRPISKAMIRYKIRQKMCENLNCDINKKFHVFAAILNGFLWAYAGSRIENFLIALLVAILFTVAIIISVIDIKIRLIPNELVLLILFLGVVFQVLCFGWQAQIHALLCMVTVGFIFIITAKFVGFEQVGAGDIKLAATIGLILGYPNIMIAVMGMCVTLLVFCVGGLLIKKLVKNSTFPFAPFIMFGTIFTYVSII
ncbi:prepilin peptidase [Anaerotignum sp.]|uniref:prepilin peptidase n=1 Tax=Anaerotignum sp. TaxID=2039241 RepID=UPI002714DFAD|nr:prepilin peptidase [Anaerotignum sp.]